MEVRVKSTPDISGITWILRVFLCDLVLPVDTSFAADGFYHVRSQDIVDVLRQKGDHTASNFWERRLDCGQMSHLAIPHECCQQWPPEERMPLEAIDVLEAGAVQITEVT